MTTAVDSDAVRRSGEVPDAAGGGPALQLGGGRLAALDLPEMRSLVVDAWAMVVPKAIAARVR